MPVVQETTEQNKENTMTFINCNHKDGGGCYFGTSDPPDEYDFNWDFCPACGHQFNETYIAMWWEHCHACGKHNENYGFDLE
jgi:hypothetical protein